MTITQGVDDREDEGLGDGARSTLVALLVCLPLAALLAGWAWFDLGLLASLALGGVVLVAGGLAGDLCARRRDVATGHVGLGTIGLWAFLVVLIGGLLVGVLLTLDSMGGAEDCVLGFQCGMGARHGPVELLLTNLVVGYVLLGVPALVVASLHGLVWGAILGHLARERRADAT